MRLLSVNVGLPRTVVWRGKTVTTGIFKAPVRGCVTLQRMNLDGDRQADLTVHGGEHKAVYAYPVEHYGYWRSELPGMELPFGMFGENFTVEGLLEADVQVGNRFRIGTAELVVTQPRLPCYKLGIKFQSEDMVKRFLVSGRTGFYCSVAQEGKVEAGDEIHLISGDGNHVSIAEIARLYTTKRYGRADIETARRAAQVEALPESWRSYLLRRLEKTAP